MKVYALFNKYTDKFVSFTNNISMFPVDNFNVREIILEELGITDGNFNLAQFRWEGNYKEGRLVDLFAEKKSIVTEETVDMKYYGLFFRKYKIEEAIFALLENGAKAEEMRVFHQKLMKKKADEEKFYKESNSHIYESTEFQQQREQEIFKVDV